MVGISEDKVDISPEDELVQTNMKLRYLQSQVNLYWESQGKEKYCPIDFIEFNAADEKSSGQGIIFGTKPVEILIPYIKILTKRNDLVFEPFGGSGSTLMASIRLKRRCFLMEKSPVYAEVILNRWEKFTGKKRIKINEQTT